MKTYNILLACVVSLALAACTTVQGPNGQPQQVMSPVGAAIVQTLVSTGVGAGTGALMGNAPGWANGMASGGISSVVGQAVNAFIPQANGRPPMRQATYCGTDYPVQSQQYGQDQQCSQQGQQNQYQQRAYSQQQYGNSQQPLYARQPDGTFVRVR